MRDRKRYTFEEFLPGNLLSVMVFFNVKTVGFNYCLIDSLNVFTLRCIAALVLATLSDSKTMKDEELFSLISTKAVLFGFYDTGNITFQVTTKEKEKNTATQTTASLMNGIFQINQEFHTSEGGTLLEDHASYTAPRILARIVLSEAHAAHSAILENTKQEFMELSLQPSSK